MKLTRINFKQGHLWVTGDDFHNKNLVDGDLAYHRGLKEVGTVKKHSVQTGTWLFESKDAVTPRDNYKLFKITAQTNLELPNVPYIEIGEEDVDLLAIPLAEKYVKESEDFKAEGLSDYQNGVFNGFIEGYKAAKEKMLTQKMI